MEEKHHSMPAGSVVLALLLFFSTVLQEGADAIAEDRGKSPAPYTYHYIPKGKPDPFKSFVEQEQLLLQQQAKKAEVRSIFPLQRLNLDQFKLVGVGGSSGHWLAIVETLDGRARSYAIVTGTIIGLNHGKVVDIQADLIVIEEVIRNRNKQTIRRIVKKLRRDEEEGLQ